jgi:hypothetical protein
VKRGSNHQDLGALGLLLADGGSQPLGGDGLAGDDEDLQGGLLWK